MAGEKPHWSPESCMVTCVHLEETTRLYALLLCSSPLSIRLLLPRSILVTMPLPLSEHAVSHRGPCDRHGDLFRLHVVSNFPSKLVNTLPFSYANPPVSAVPEELKHLYARQDGEHLRWAYLSIQDTFRCRIVIDCRCILRRRQRP